MLQALFLVVSLTFATGEFEYKNSNYFCVVAEQFAVLVNLETIATNQATQIFHDYMDSPIATQSPLKNIFSYVFDRGRVSPLLCRDT